MEVEKLMSPSRDSQRSLEGFETALRKFEPKLCFEIRFGNYLVKTVSTDREFQNSLTLRQTVFENEQSVRSDLKVSADFTDLMSDHLVVIDLRFGRVVAGARLTIGSLEHDYPASRDFHLEPLIDKAGVKLECSFLCVDQGYRNGHVVAILMRGIARYASHTNAKFLFGAIAVELIESQAIVALMKYLVDSGVAELRFTLDAKDGSRIRGLPLAIAKFAARGEQEKAPQKKPRLTQLLRLLIRFGARVSLLPAKSADLKRTSFLTVLDLQANGSLNKFGA